MKLRVWMVLTVLFVLLAASPSFAQRPLTYGVKGGINFANLSLEFEDFDGPANCCDQKVAGVFGGFVKVGINENISFQPELLYTYKGAKETEFGQTANINLTYLQIPMLGVWDFPTSGMVRPFIVAGPGLGFNTSARVTVEGFDEDEDIENIETLDFGLIFGGGVAFGNFTAEARYDLGLGDVDGNEDASAKTRTFSILFGYGIMR